MGVSIDKLNDNLYELEQGGVSYEVNVLAKEPTKGFELTFSR